METKTLTKIGGIAALYAVITILFNPISYGPVQVRISEGLTILPFFLGPWSAVGLWLGCLIANFAGGLGLIDVIFGSLLTLIAGLLTSQLDNIWLAGLPPVIINAFGVAGILKYVAEFEAAYLVIALQVGIGEAVAVYLIGVLGLGQAFKRTKLKSILMD